MRAALQRHGGIGEAGFQFTGALKQSLGFVGLKRGEPGGCSQGMTRIGVAVEKFDHMLRTVHEGVVNVFAHNHAAHGNGSGRYALGKGHDVRRNAEAFGRRCKSKPAEG